MSLAPASESECHFQLALLPSWVPGPYHEADELCAPRKSTICLGLSLLGLLLLREHSGFRCSKSCSAVRARGAEKSCSPGCSRELLSLCRCCPRECSLRHNRQVRPSPGLPTLCTPVGAGKLEQVHSASVVLLLHFFAPRRLESTQCSIVARELSAEGGQHGDRWCCLQPVECNGHRRCGRMRQAKTR